MNIVYGLSAVKFAGKEIGYIDNNGIQPAGTAPTRTPIYAAQKKDGPIINLMSSPGATAFNITLVDLNAEGLVATIGGEKDTSGNYTPPKNAEKSGVMDFEADSGHTIRLFNARVSLNDFANGLNSSNLLGLQLHIEVEADESGKTWKMFAPGINPATGQQVVEG